MLRVKHLRHILVLSIAAPLISFSFSAAAAAPPASSAGSAPDIVEELRFHPASTAAGDGVAGRLEVRFPGKRLSRTLVQWVLGLASSLMQANEHGFYNLRLSGEVRRDALAVDHFDYRFDIPVDEGADEPLALVFDRDLRPGRYQLALKLEDLASGRSFATEDDLEVPEIGEPAPPGPRAPAIPSAGPTAFAAAMSLVAPEPPVPASIDLATPREPILVGLHRFAATARGDGIASVAFLLDGEPVLTRHRPPFTVELDLGDHAEVRRLEVEAYDAAGAVVARDELTLNTGRERLAVELVEPRAGASVGHEMVARARLEVPAGRRVVRLEYLLGDELVRVVDRPPFDVPVTLPGRSETTAVRAVVHLADGRSAEDTVLVNAPDVVDEVAVHLVELYTAVVDRKGRSVDGLTANDFLVTEDGAPQRVTRFGRVGDLPLHASLVLDVSGSMGTQLDEACLAAVGFLRQALTPRDRASIVTFDSFPRVVVDFTDDFDRLANGVTGLAARGGTALHEGLMFALRQFDGVEGQRVVLLFSDGIEERPQDSAAILEYGRRSGVTLYTVGFRVPWDAEPQRQLLERLATETGGRAFFVDAASELAAVYDQIGRDMRSRYLLTYQSSNPSGDGFRVVDVDLSRPGLAARTVHGYYP